MVARLLLGRDQWGTYCFRTSKPGRDVWTSNPATAPDAFTFNSDWSRVEEIHQAGTATFRPIRPIYTGVDDEPIAVTSDNSLFFPSLGYVPMFSVMMHRDGLVTEMEQVDTAANGDPMRANRFVPWISYEWINALRMSPLVNGTLTTLPTDPSDGIPPYSYQTIDYVIWKLPGG